MRNITIPNNSTLAYIVGGLERATPYAISVLAYTVADGPRSIYLTAITLCKKILKSYNSVSETLIILLLHSSRSADCWIWCLW